MAIRLYDSAWVLFRENDEPQQVRKDPKNPGMFHVGGFQYDIDGRPYYVTQATPDIVQLLSIQVVREKGLSANALR